MESVVPASMYAHLTEAYEQCLIESGDIVAVDEIRLKLLGQLTQTPIPKAYFIISALAKCNDISGDVCEFGVARGATSALIANEIQHSNKVLHLFDSFEGLPNPTEKDALKDDIYKLGSIQAYKGQMSCPDEMVRARLSAISFPPNRYVVHKGFIEQVLRDDLDLPSTVSFAYVDFDFYEPIKQALVFLNGTTSSGAMIIVDDYNYFSTGAKTAVDEFLHEMNSKGLTYKCYIPDPRFGCFAVLTRVDF